ncbi:serine protease [Rhizobium leguminosarum]|uniref:S1 family peptidase n=1 Tax=Rhizobium leguminosarum TaxID=384 RepID=UPI003F99B89A
MSRSKSFSAELFAVIVVTLSFGAALAQEGIHDLAKSSLVKLSAQGAPRLPPNVGEPDGVKSSGTGFFVGNGGYILTTEHFFALLIKQRAMNVKIRGEFFGTGGGSVPVSYISALPAFDLVLLKAIVPFGMTQPAALEIGSTADVNKEEPGLMTSGFFEGKTYNKQKLQFNDNQSEDVPFAWSVSGTTEQGESGSPVYIAKGGKPLVVGVVKATKASSNKLMSMIPIEHSLPLIGHFKFQELSETVGSLSQVIGNDALPGSLIRRVGMIENLVKEIEKNFRWSAETVKEDGSILIRYEKVLKNGPNIDEISVKITPTIYMKNESTGVKEPYPVIPPMSYSVRKSTSLDSDESVGEFRIEKFQDELTETILKGDAEVIARDEQPYSDIEIRLIINIDGNMVRKKVTILPTYNWKYRKVVE